MIHLTKLSKVTRPVAHWDRMLMWKQASAQKLLPFIKEKEKETSCLELDTWNFRSIRPYIVPMPGSGNKGVLLLGVCIISVILGVTYQLLCMKVHLRKHLQRRNCYEILRGGRAKGKSQWTGTDLIGKHLHLCCKNACHNVIFYLSYSRCFKRFIYCDFLWESMKPQNIVFGSLHL